ncbi:MAG: sulfatase-like hydrolase/transferase [Kiritimatiellia bacterium]
MTAGVCAAERPNILILLADDLGYGELSCQGNPQIPTPNIDSIGRNGIRFTSGYVSAPICCPSRAGLLTGRSQTRFGFEFNLGSAGGGLPPKERTIANYLKEAGYATGMFGKWHLGYTRDSHPQHFGFDWFFGFLPACRPYAIPPKGLGKSLLENGGGMTYTTDAFAAEAAAFIEAHKDRPWFVYLPFNAVHASPTGGRKLVRQDAGRYYDLFPNIKDEQRRIYAGMEAALDQGVGTVLAKLRELKLEENTLIFFLSDNGGPTWQTTSRNDPLSGHKGDLLEGGIREPFMIQWKGRIPAGRVDDRPIISRDILPTAIAVAGVAGDDKPEGVNLLPYLTGEKAGNPHEMLFWRYGEKRAVRAGDWKLTDQGDGAKLYNITRDIGETTDLAGKEPGKLKELEAAYAKWNEKNIRPMWQPPGGRKKQKSGAAVTPQARVAFRLEDDS